MKKHILWILPLILFIIIIFLYTSVPYFYRTWFTIRHTLVYFLFAYILVFSIYYFTKKILRRVRNKQLLTKIIILSNSIVVCTILFLVSSLQVTFIDLYEVPPLDGCSYYDDFGNLLYQTRFNTCGEVVDYTQDNNTLEMTFVETYQGQAREYVTTEDGFGIVEGHLNATITTYIHMTYAQKGLPLRIEKTVYETLKRSNETFDTHSVTGMVTYNLIETTFNENTVEVSYETAYKSNLFDAVSEVTFPPINSLDKETKVYQSILYENEGEMYIDILETINDETNTIIKGVFKNVNDPLFLLDFYDGDKYNGISTDVEIGINEIIYRNIVSRQEDSINRDYSESRTITFDSISYPMIEAVQTKSDGYTLSDFQGDFNGTLQVDRQVEYHDIDNTQYRILTDEYLLYDEVSIYYVTDYGFFVENYSLHRYDNGSYYENFDKIEKYTPGIIDLTGHSFDDDFYDYLGWIRYPGIQSEFHYYQANPLLEGFIFDYIN